MNILITGHSRGIGKYLFDNLKYNYQVFGFSRENGFDLRKKETFKKISEFFISFNSSVDKNKIISQQQSKHSGIGRNGIVLDILILNAGIGEFGKFEDISIEKYEDIINLNLLANIRLLKVLEKNTHGEKSSWGINKNTKIVFIGSIISKKFLKFASVYQSSKFAIRGLAGGLKKEGKKVFLINPKIVNTDFHKGKVELDKRFPETKLENILDVIKKIIFSEEKRFEIDL